MATMTPNQAFHFWPQKEAANPMHDDLKRLLDLVWTNRNRPDVYGLYIRAGKAIDFSLAGVRQFLVELYNLGRIPEVQESSGSPFGSWIIKNYKAYSAPNGGFLLMPPAEWRALIVRAQTSENVVGYMAKTFYHFRSRTPGGSNERIYLHVSPVARATVMGFLLQSVCTIPGVSNAKVGPPSREYRYDTIVIYLNNKATVDLALAQIAIYQKRNKSFFEHGSPRLLKVISRFKDVDLVGVAAGSEPQFTVKEEGGRLVRVRGTTSFGTLRGTIIEFALTQTYNPATGLNGTKQQFIDRVVADFKALGLNPQQPSVG